MLIRSVRVGTRCLARQSFHHSAPVNCLLLNKKRVSSVFSTSRCLQRGYSTEPPSSPNSEVSFSPEKLLQALEMMADSCLSLPPIPPGQDQESFWRAYLLANQIVMYLAARPPTEAETFASIFQSASVPESSAIAKGRIGVFRITKQIVNTMRDIPPTSSLRSSYPEVFQTYGALQKIYNTYVPAEEDVNDLDRWSMFFVGLRTELVEFAVRIGMVVEGWESAEQQRKK
ncbi:hypothetical protein J3R30DRAFT_3505667 [Lentinula aciculospora]|uniref:Uncharacterized protein n=1 Tax=Lentinula aciculospora TaxID=153920 RepID=A0A9W9DL85_9AGAR|nr:hypothetical protein J3R30DRAFT_3505667 [Lentinula aciculospora]